MFPFGHMARRDTNDVLCMFKGLRTGSSLPGHTGFFLLMIVHKASGVPRYPGQRESIAKEPSVLRCCLAGGTGM